ncbi:rod shape-determining protein MreC [Nocardioides dubius]|uniref:Cell shape-determining protein MreC n=1 Tax=Nocardioides dubius TaxID=317019 RepID=A0ABN1TZC2_9ACTN
MAGPWRERRWKREVAGSEQDRSARAVLIALVLASVTLIVLDHQADGPLDAARRAVGEVVGPAESVGDAVVEPFAAIPDFFRTRSDLRDDVRELQAENDRLRSEANTADLDRNRLAEYDGLAKAATDIGYSLLPAKVIGVGPRQSFSQTVTIDAGSSSGLTSDLTVVNSRGLVGRVIRVTRTTATVLLVLDTDSVVGGRLASSMEIGFLKGRGEIGDDALLDLELIDDTVIATKGDVVTTWGSKDGAPYVAGVPIGKVVSVISSPRETSRVARIEPFVDFSSLDLVGVVVPGGTSSDRVIFDAEGSR